MKNLFLDFLLLINAMQAIHNLLLVRYGHISRKSYRRSSNLLTDSIGCGHFLYIGKE